MNEYPNKFSKIKQIDHHQFRSLSDTTPIKQLNKKINASMRHYARSNEKKIKENKEIRCCKVYFCDKKNINKINVTYNSNYQYFIHFKCENQSYERAKKIVKCIMDKKRNDYFSIDIDMEKYYSNKKESTENTYAVYYLVILLKNEWYEVYSKGVYISIDNEFYKYIKPYYDKLKNSSDKGGKLLYLHILFEAYQKRITYNNKESQSISQGEIYMLFMLILLFDLNILINTKEIRNPKTGYNLQFDFVIKQTQDNKIKIIAIEVNGSHHDDDEQKQNDAIKKGILNDAIKLTTIDWEGKKKYEKFINDTYEKMVKNYPGYDFMIKEEFINIMKFILEKIVMKTRSFDIDYSDIDTILTKDDMANLDNNMKNKIKIAKALNNMNFTDFTQN